MLTRRAHLLAGLATGLALATWLSPTRAHTGENTPDGYDVVIYEDGSGAEMDGTREVRTFPADTFFWDCATMGNRHCGIATRPE